MVPLCAVLSKDKFGGLKSHGCCVLQRGGAVSRQGRVTKCRFKRYLSMRVVLIVGLKLCWGSEGQSGVDKVSAESKLVKIKIIFNT